MIQWDFYFTDVEEKYEGQKFQLEDQLGGYCKYLSKRKVGQKYKVKVEGEKARLIRLIFTSKI